jgi:RimJ/RimL family protein N-acetyltransferase
MMIIPELETERLYLRGIEPKHIPAYQQAFAHYEVIRFLNDQVPWPYPENGVDEYMREHVFPHQGKTRWLWCIFPKEQPGTLIGAIELLRDGNPANRGFWLTPAHQGRGYMTEAAIVTTDFAFDQLGFEKLVLENAANNIQSARIKEKSGARLVRREPQRYVDPNLTIAEIWELTKEDWQHFKKQHLSKPSPPPPA